MVRNLKLPRGQFAFAQVLEATEATRSQLINWTNKRVIVPRIEEASGPGTVQIFDFDNLVEVRVAVLLSGLKIPGPVLRRCLTALAPHVRARAPFVFVPLPVAEAGPVPVVAASEFAGPGLGGIYLAIEVVVAQMEIAALKV